MKPDLDLIEPRGVRGSKMECQPSSSSDPLHDIRVLMERQIVDNDVKVLVGMSSIQLLEERQEDVAVIAIHAAGFHRALMHGECGQQTRVVPCRVYVAVSRLGFPGLRGSSG